MKMTPEQKAFFEYGGAWEQVVLTNKGIRSTIKALPGKTRQKLLRRARNETHQHELILNAWQKRAACRAWVPLIHRDCHNCAYKNIKPVPVVCNPCINEGFAVNWEPRKEASND